MFKGVCTALITPFDKKGKIDFKSFDNFINFQLKNGVDALLVAGTTGEPSTLSKEEKRSVIEFVINKVNKRVPVIVGAGCNSTMSAVENAVEAEKLGADCLLVVTPYYNKCSQEGLYQHYKAINDAVNIPIIAYNVPGRTGVNISVETLLRLQELNNLIGIKEASGNIDQINKIARRIDKSKFKLFSGDDSLTLPMLSLGAEGVISVASNIIPKEMHDLVTSYLDGDINKSRDIHFKYADLMDNLFIDVNPIPIKAACAKLKLMENTLRLPLTNLSNENDSKLDMIMKKVKLI